MLCDDERQNTDNSERQHASDADNNQLVMHTEQAANNAEQTVLQQCRKTVWQ